MHTDIKNLDAYLKSDTKEKEKENETLEIAKVDLEELDKEALISLIKDKDTIINHQNTLLENKKEEMTKELENMNKYYSKLIKDKTAVINYYERKLNVLRDIINIETGGEE